MDERLLELRELMINAPNPAATRGVALVIGIGVLVTVLWLVRARRLQAEYTPIWMVLAVVTCAVGAHLQLLRGVAHWIGAWTLSSTIFFLGLIALGAISLHYAVQLSRAGLQIKTLAQEVALLRHQVERISEGSGAGGQPR